MKWAAKDIRLWWLASMPWASSNVHRVYRRSTIEFSIESSLLLDPTASIRIYTDSNISR